MKKVTRAARELRAVGIPVEGGVPRLGPLRLRLIAQGSQASGTSQGETPGSSG